jgi:hypothetical protein
MSRHDLFQLEQFKLLSERLGAELEKVCTHTSKSIQLPVVALQLDGHSFLLRDNFYDVNLCVLGKGPIQLSLSEMFEGVLQSLDWDWYLETIKRARGYSWREWSDKEMDDPKILCVFSDGRDGQKIPWTKRQEEKDRWIKRMVDPSWYRHDWSRGSLSWQGKFGPGVVLFEQRHPFAEGISKIVSRKSLAPYFPGVTDFALALKDIDAAETIIRRVVGEELGRGAENE